MLHELVHAQPTFNRIRPNHKTVSENQNHNCLPKINHDTFQLSFKGCNEKNLIINSDSQIMGIATNISLLFRDAEMYDAIPDYFNKELPKGASFYCFGSADSSEVYSYIIKLKEKLGNESDKFFPIKASDIFTDMITKSQNGIIYMDDREIKEFKNNSDYELNNYFTKELSDTTELTPKNLFSNPYYKFIVNKNIRDHAEFKVANIADEIKNIPKDEPVIISFKNTWEYLHLDEEKVVLKNLKKLKKGSLFIIGNSELTSQCLKVPNKLVKAGYQQVIEKSLSFVFKKIK